MSTVSRNDAIRALTSYAKSGKPVDPSDESSIELYINMRSTMQRVSADTFVRWSTNSSKRMSLGCAWEVGYYGVPKSNFPKGLPPPIKKLEVPTSTLEGCQLMGGGTEVDHANYYVVDMAAERHMLGQNVMTLRFYGKAKRNLTEQPAPSGGYQREPATIGGGHFANHGPSSSGSGPHSLEDAPTPTLGDGPAPRGGTVRRHGSDGGSDEEPVAKKARLLQATMETLRDSIRAAADAGRWTSVSAFSTNTVNFPITELYDVMRDQFKVGCQPTAAVHIAGFLSRIFMKRPMFEHLAAFKTRFTELANISGRKPQDLGVLIERLANLTADGDGMVSFADVHVTARMTFRECVLYLNFVHLRLASKLKKARVQPTAELKMKHLEDILSAGYVDSAPHKTAEIAKTLFNPLVSDTDKLTYIQATPQAAEVLY